MFINCSGLSKRSVCNYKALQLPNRPDRNDCEGKIINELFCLQLFATIVCRTEPHFVHAVGRKSRAKDLGRVVSVGPELVY
jgi:hypothetical protein